MKVKLKFSNAIAKMINVGAITLYPYILFSVDQPTAAKHKIIEHEMVHVRQVRKLGWLKFYFSYIYSYFKNLWKYKNGDLAYRNIEYEMEAFDHQHTMVLTQEEIDEIQGQH